jgi:TonB family protein
MLLFLVPRLTLSKDQTVSSSAPSLPPSTSTLKELIGVPAARLADAIARSKNEPVVVFDFIGSDGRLGALGAALADDFSTALSGSPEKVHVKDHSRLNKLMAENRLESENIFDPDIATWLAEDLGAEALVLGKLESGTGNIKLSLTAYTVRDGKGIIGLAITIPLTDEMKALIPDTIENQAANRFLSADGKCFANGLPTCGGANGYSSPKCVHCPSPNFSDEAKDRRAQGTVLIVAIIDESGRARDIRVARGLPYGLTQQAVQAVQKWTFQSAIAPDGKRVAVRQVIEVSFHLE